MQQYEAASVIQAELGPKEQLLWSGTPRSGFVLRKSDRHDIPLTLLVAGFVIWWEWDAISKNKDTVSILWGVLFVLVAHHLMIGRFFVDAWRRNRTCFAVTNERIITLTQGLFGQQTRSLDIRVCYDMTLDLNRDGSGTIIFNSPPRPVEAKVIENAPPPKILHRSFRLSPMPPTPKLDNEDSEYIAPTFEMIPDAKNVYNLIRQAQQNA